MRRVVLHADDLGMSHGANAAFAEFGLRHRHLGLGDGSLPLVRRARRDGRDDPALDVGVHLS